MQLDRPFRIVTSSVDGDVLSVLARADAAFTPPEVHRLLGERSEAGVRNALSRLRDQGIVDAERIGHAVSYRLNREHLGAGPVIELAQLRARLLERLRQVLAGWLMEPRYAALFGSAASGPMRPDSDIDLFLVRPRGIDADEPTWVDQVNGLSTAVSRWTGNDARVLEYDDDDVDAGLRGEGPCPGRHRSQRGRAPRLDPFPSAEPGSFVVAASKRCGEATRRGRLDKARQFADAAEIIETMVDGSDLDDAYITLCVHAGIAAADVLCCARMGVHAQGDDHTDAVALLERVDSELAAHLRTLLAMKTAAGYGALRLSAAKQKRAGRAMRHLVDAAVAEPK